MESIKVLMVAHQNASEGIFEKGRNKVRQLLGDFNFEFSEEKPDLVFFITGGSEKEAIEQIKNQKLVILAGDQTENSYAAATEVKAFLNGDGTHSILIDLTQPGYHEHLLETLNIVSRLKTLDQQRLGLIGKVSDWLIASNINARLLDAKFGIQLLNYEWNTLPVYYTLAIDKIFSEKFNSEPENLAETSKVYALLSNLVSNEKLDAITVECFSLVQKANVTACLPLARLNDTGIPSGCEGDLCSITGMMLIKALTGSIPWMANLASVGTDNAVFAHCTIPLNKVIDHEVTTHFETGKGTSIKGRWKEKQVTIFRLNNQLDKAFLTRAAVIEIPEITEACRTQIRVQMNSDALEKLRTKPLGNHHLIIEGNWVNQLKLACQLKEISLI